MMQSFVEEICKHKPEIILSNIKHYDKGNIKFVEVKNTMPYEKVLNKELIQKHLIQPYFGGEMGIIPSVCTKLYNTEFLKSHDLNFNENLKRAEDYWFNFYAFQKAKSVYCINQSFYHYYYNPGSMMRQYRVGQFETFIQNRKRLLNAHKDFKFPINLQNLNNGFIHNINEYILLEINSKGLRQSYSTIYNYLKNQEFIDIYLNSNISKIHVQLIKFFLSHNLTQPSFWVYYIWSLKAKL